MALWNESKTKQMDCFQDKTPHIQSWRNKIQSMRGEDLTMKAVHKYPEAVLACVKRLRWENDILYKEYKKYKQSIAESAISGCASRSQQRPRQRQEVDGRKAFEDQIHHWRNQSN